MNGQEDEGRRNQQRRKERAGERRKATCTKMKRRTEHMLTHFFDVLRLLISLLILSLFSRSSHTWHDSLSIHSVTRTHALKLMRTRESTPLLISTFIELNLLTSFNRHSAVVSYPLAGRLAGASHLCVSTSRSAAFQTPACETALHMSIRFTNVLHSRREW